ncbi:hypothetical protein GGI01_000319 [Coemansia sp. RSA 376]|nr:hypothetical protein H4S03_008056 [Coemansia sp. S3946]KAJ2101162.1 hypothetical protein IW146_009393 [Coemansia sp. RSA 922]KAJ2263981.1 hypothetical protein GGI01_000319 [Coemansia sp. RSA 376]
MSGESLLPLRVYDYTVLATLGLTALYGSIGSQLEDEHTHLSPENDSQMTLAEMYASPQTPLRQSRRYRVRQATTPSIAGQADGENVRAGSFKRKSAFNSSSATETGSPSTGSARLLSPVNSSKHACQTASNGRTNSSKRMRDTTHGCDTAAPRASTRLKSAFARVRSDNGAEGDSGLENAEALGRRGRPLPAKVNANANHSASLCETRPKEYGEVWFNRYLILARLGEGAFSQAFLAADLHCNRMGRRHDAIRLVSIKRMGIEEGAIGISDYQTISILNRLDSKDRVPIVRIYDIFLHCPRYRRTVEYDAISRQLVPAQQPHTAFGINGLSRNGDVNGRNSHIRYGDNLTNLRVFGDRNGAEPSGPQYGSDPFTSSASIAPAADSYHVCLVMEPLLGGTLHDAFPRRIKALYLAHDEVIARQMHMDMIRTVTRQLLVALEHMHSVSLIHADVKTTNVICVNDATMRVKLIDFGNAVSDGDVSEYYSTFEIQTVWFRAPEVAYQRPFGRAIDIWSIGCVMCELWLGRSLFTDMGNHNLMSSMLKLRGPPPARLYSASPFYAEMVGSWKRRSAPGFAPAVVAGRHKNTMHPEQSMDWDPQLRMQWLKHSLHVQDDEFVSLADALLEYDPEERLTAAEALRHPFFQGMYAL